MIRTRYLAVALVTVVAFAPLGGGFAFAADDPTPTPTPSLTPGPTPTQTTPPVPTPTPTPTPKPTQTTPPAPTQAITAAQKINIEKVSATSVKLTWQQPRDTKPKETVHYYVQLKISLDGTVVDTRTESDTTKTSLTYTKVQPGAVVRPEVTTIYRHDLGEHDYGKPYTLAQVKPGVVTQVDVRAVAHNKTRKQPDVAVTFEAPDTTDGAGTLIDRYELRLYDATSGKLISKKTSQSAYYTFEKVAYKTFYYVQIRAHNSAGYGKSVKTKEVVTAEKVLYPEFLIPLPHLPGTQPPVTHKPTPSVTLTPTPSATPTVAPPAKDVDLTTGFRPAWFNISLLVALGTGVVLTFFTVLYYRRHPWRG